jgi:galactokinase
LLGEGLLATPSTLSRESGSTRARAPGRVNLIGEHTDYNEGLVLPIAIDRACEVSAIRRDDRLLRIRSRELGETAEASLDRAVPRGHWSDYPVGVAVMLEAGGVRVSGADLAIESEVPPGAGLSSSAALEVAVARALLELAGTSLDEVSLARLCQRAENEFVGARCGIMDQFVSISGRAGHALMLDCRTLGARHVPLPESLRIVVVDSGVRHSIAAGEYNRRREECDEAVRLLAARRPRIRALRDLTPADLGKAAKLLPPVLARRARHVVTENARVEATAAALEDGRLGELPGLLSESHTSLTRDYEVSCAELDLLVQLAGDAPGCCGARMTGGGFGGSTVNLVRQEQVSAFAESVQSGYRRETGREAAVHVCRAADGACTALPIPTAF